jgi:transcriptional regulator GlxA family with amidase domain
LIQPSRTRRINETTAEMSKELAQPRRFENMKNKAHLQSRRLERSTD